jgi:hypothetical protein
MMRQLEDVLLVIYSIKDFPCHHIEAIELT